jgi:hypothetical protein
LSPPAAALRKTPLHLAFPPLLLRERGRPSTTWALPQPPPAPTHYPVPQDQIGSHGSVTLRYLGRLRDIRIGVQHRNCKVLFLVAGDDLRILTANAKLLRQTQLDADRIHFGLGGGWPVHNALKQELLCPETRHLAGREGFEPSIS